MAALLGELETARLARRNAEEERDALGLRLRELHTEMETVKSAAAAEEEARTARLGEAEHEAARLNKEVAELRKDHAELGRRATALEAEKEALAAQRAQLETECRTFADATRVAEVAEQRLREAVDALARMRIERDTSKAAHDLLADQNPSLASAKAAAEKDAALQRKEAAAMRKGVSALESDSPRFREAADD